MGLGAGDVCVYAMMLNVCFVLGCRTYCIISCFHPSHTPESCEEPQCDLGPACRGNRLVYDERKEQPFTFIFPHHKTSTK